MRSKHPTTPDYAEQEDYRVMAEFWEESYKELRIRDIMKANYAKSYPDRGDHDHHHDDNHDDHNDDHHEVHHDDHQDDSYDASEAQLRMIVFDGGLLPAGAPDITPQG